MQRAERPLRFEFERFEFEARRKMLRDASILTAVIYLMLGHDMSAVVVSRSEPA